MKSTNTAPFKIGIFGSAVDEVTLITEKAKQIGRELAVSKVIIITGACSGIPNVVASAAHQNGAEIWGFSPTISLKKYNQLESELDYKIFKKLLFVSKNYQFAQNIEICRKYRNVASTAACDAGIIISGRWGTMNEFTNLHDMGKIIGILTGTGGIADEIQNLARKINKPTGAKLIFESNPENLVDSVIAELKKKTK